MMERDDSILLHEPDLMLAVLRVAAARAGGVDACIDHLRALRARAEVEERLPEADVRAQLRAITAKLDRASLIEWPRASGFRITARGRQVLADHPSGVDDSVLMQLEERAVSTSEPTLAREPPAPKASQYDAGYQAHGNGRSLADNPHPSDARAHLDWQNGWSQAHDEATRQSGRR